MPKIPNMDLKLNLTELENQYAELRAAARLGQYADGFKDDAHLSAEGKRMYALDRPGLKRFGLDLEGGRIRQEAVRRLQADKIQVLYRRGNAAVKKCKISMLWNWYTEDACFITRNWRISSNGIFALTCIGVVLLVITLELLRRSAKEYDRYILRNHIKVLEASIDSTSQPSSRVAVHEAEKQSFMPKRKFRPSLLQQLVRALLHMAQFGIAYLIMLLAMYYNGYIIISILIGAFIGAFIFQWETISFGGEKKQEEATLCCG